MTLGNSVGSIPAVRSLGFIVQRERLHLLQKILARPQMDPQIRADSLHRKQLSQDSARSFGNFSAHHFASVAQSHQEHLSLSAGGRYLASSQRLFIFFIQSFLRSSFIFKYPHCCILINRKVKGIQCQTKFL